LTTINATLHNIDNRLAAVSANGNISSATAFARYLERQSNAAAAIRIDGRTSLTLYHNATLINTSPAAIAMLQMANAPSQTIVVGSHPLPARQITFDSASFVGVMFLGLAFCFGVSGFAIDIVRVVRMSFTII
jgi:hypothetical protein